MVNTSRLEKDKLEAFFAWLEEIKPKTLPKSALGKAVNYALNYKEGLSVYLQIGRKNWLFSASQKGAAEVSCAVGRKGT